VPAFYPAFLDLRGKPVLVVGGGAVAERKVEQLMASGAQVTIVSPDVTAAVETWAADGLVTLTRREYLPGDVQGQALAIAATDDVAVNRTVATEARAAGVWVNAVDDVEFCDFIAPAVVEQGGITIAISTGGKSPAMARFLRRHLQQTLSQDLATLLTLAEEVRLRLRREGRPATPDAWQEALEGEALQLVRAGAPEAAKQRLYDNLIQVEV
jgi:siroheme synthase-like protein